MESLDLQVSGFGKCVCICRSNICMCVCTCRLVVVVCCFVITWTGSKTYKVVVTVWVLPFCLIRLFLFIE